MKRIFTLLFVGSTLLASAQSTFKTRVFPTDFNYLTKVAQLNDGSLVSAGYIGGGDDAMWLVKTSAAGAVLASKRITTDGYDEAFSITKTSDGGFAVTGTLNDGIGLLKFGADLSLQWQQAYDINHSDGSGALKVVQTADGGYLLAGYVSNAIGGFAGSLIKTNSLGVIQFQKRYFIFSLSVIYDLSPTTDGNYAFLAGASDNGSDIDLAYVGKVKPDGTLVWAKQVSQVDFSSLTLNAVIGASDGGIVASGSSFAEITGGDGKDQMTMLKFDANGGLTWSKVLRSDSVESEAYTILEDKDGGYLFAGYGDDNTNSYGYAVKTSSAGALLWKKTFESDTEGYTDFTDLTATPDGGFVITGDGYLPDGAGDYNDAGIIYKFNSSFDACGETAGTADGNLINSGSIALATLPATNTTLASVTASITITDVEDVIGNVCNSLPVHLTSFTAALQGRSVNVNWTTANEVNADYFVVERSADKRSFTALQKIAAKGSSSITQSYSINDLQPLPGTSYYRLKEVDKDGKTTYSSIVPVTVMSNGTIVISPNPVQNNIRVIVQSTASSNLTLQVIDMKGTVLAAQTRTVGTGRNEINIAASSLVRGVYVLKVTDSKTTQAIRFVKE